MLSYKSRCAILILVSLAITALLLLAGPMAQDPHYHQFANDKHIAGIDNFWNVISNLPFVLVGLFGLSRVTYLAQAESRTPYVVLCVGVALVGFGSAYYHYAPTNATLLWDRLPMTVAFMALFYLLLQERVLSTPKPYLLWLLVAVGVGSALYWSWSETQGRGDLRPYVLVQFLPLILIPLILLLFKRQYLDGRLLLAAFGWYALAKVLEHFDEQIYATVSVMSGHPLKHVAAAVAVLCIIQAVPQHASR